jgi:hypothetical protein
MKIGLVGRSGITAFLGFAFLSLSPQIRAQFARLLREARFPFQRLSC